jgi:elongation factor Ts
MSKVSILEISKLREETGLGIVEIKKALEKADGNHDKAVLILRESGAMKAEKKADRAANFGIVDSYIHGEGRIGVLIEVLSETDFVARNQDFKNFVHEVALHIAAAAPRYLSRDQVDKEEIEKEKKIYRQQLKNEGKPAAMIEKIIEGKMKRYFSEICLLEQNYIKNPDQTIENLLHEKISMIGENIIIKRFARFEIGC